MNRILLVDDDDKLRNVYRALLSGEGYDIVDAANVEDAVRILLNKHIQLVLLDINMPGMNGLVMREVLRIHNRQIKVIVSSVYPKDFQRRAIPQADDYFDKAEGTMVLVDKIRKCFAAAKGNHDPVQNAS